MRSSIPHAAVVQPQAMVEHAPTKIMDGLFIGDGCLALDSQWLLMNQVTHIVNCAGALCTQNSKLPGLFFLTFQWDETATQLLTEQSVVNALFGFIEQARKGHGSVLIHYQASQSRPFCLVTIYLMIKYKWSLFKSLEFVNSRKPDVELEPAFLDQLSAFHQKMSDRGLIKSRNWVPSRQFTDQELVLTNTYLNARLAKPEQCVLPNKRNNKGIAWKKDQTEVVSFASAVPVAHLLLPLTNNGDRLDRRRATSTTSVADKKQTSVTARPKQVQKQVVKEAFKEVNLASGKIINRDVTPIPVNRKMNRESDEPCTLLRDSNDSLNSRWTQIRSNLTKDKENIDNNQSQLNKPRLIDTVKPIAINDRKISPARKRESFNINAMEEKIAIIENRKGQPLGRLQPEDGQLKRTSNLKNDTKETIKWDKAQTCMTPLNNNWMVKVPKDPVIQDRSAKDLKKKPIIIKPGGKNDFLNGDDNNSHQEYFMEKRDELKNKSSSQPKFFRQTTDSNQSGQRGRSNSVKQQRKDTSLGTAVQRNSSFQSKGSWR